MNFGICQFHCKSGHKQVKWNEIKQDTCKSYSIFPYLQRGTLFKWLLKFISWEGLFQKMNDSISGGKISV